LKGFDKEKTELKEMIDSAFN